MTSRRLELLVFEAVTRAGRREPEPPPTRKQQKKMKAKLDELRTKLADRKEARRPRRSRPMREPRYDEVYAEGVAWLDSLADGAPEEHEGILEIDESVWRSDTRTDRGDP